MTAQPPGPPPAPPPPPAPALNRGWLRALIHGVRQDGLQPRDPRVKALWDLLRRRHLLGRDPWIRTRLRYIWQRGLNARHRPRTTTRLLALLRSGNVLSARPLKRHVPMAPRTPAAVPAPMRRLQPVTLRRIATLQPVARHQPVRPLSQRRVGR